MTDNSEAERQPDDACISVCPVCQGKMETVYQRNNQHVCVCVDCHTAVTVPGTAWKVAKIKREARGYFRSLKEGDPRP